MPVPRLVVTYVNWWHSRYKSNLCYSFFSVTEMPKLFAITEFYNIWGKEMAAFTRTHFQELCHWLRNAACINIVESFQFQLHTTFALGWEMWAATSLSFILQLLHSSPAAQGAPVKTGSRIFDRSQSFHFIAIKSLKNTHLNFVV